MNKTSHKIYIALVLGLSFFSPISGYSQPVNSPNNDSEATVWAKESGIVLGKARFCNFEPDLIESYINGAQALISRKTINEKDLVVSRIAFANASAAAAATEPTGGCDSYLDIFKREIGRLE